MARAVSNAVVCPRLLEDSAEGAVGADVLGAVAVGDDLAAAAHVHVLLLLVASEAPVLRLVDVLASRELHLSAAQGLDGVFGERGLGADGKHGLADAHAGHETSGLAVGVAHTGLKTISTGARKHLVDAEHLVRVSADAHVEAFLASVLDHELVAGNAGGLESLGGDLLALVGDHVHAHGELVDSGLLAADLVDLDLGIRHTTAEARADVRLLVAVAVAASGAASHGEKDGGRKGGN